MIYYMLSFHGCQSFWPYTALRQPVCGRFSQQRGDFGASLSVTEFWRSRDPYTGAATAVRLGGAAQEVVATRFLATTRRGKLRPVQQATSFYMAGMGAMHDVHLFSMQRTTPSSSRMFFQVGCLHRNQVNQANACGNKFCVKDAGLFVVFAGYSM